MIKIQSTPVTFSGYSQETANRRADLLKNLSSVNVQTPPLETPTEEKAPQFTIPELIDTLNSYFRCFKPKYNAQFSNAPIQKIHDAYKTVYETQEAFKQLASQIQGIKSTDELLNIDRQLSQETDFTLTEDVAKAIEAKGTEFGVLSKLSREAETFDT